ncbi:MAG: hypothetical protein CM15mP18_2330 [Methanobacteriota archaeon]|nr:MAG: hypothetical protein CM15mP18_2330 [Euryarchaeota archaeon]
MKASSCTASESSAGPGPNVPPTRDLLVQISQICWLWDAGVARLTPPQPLARVVERQLLVMRINGLEVIGMTLGPRRHVHPGTNQLRGVHRPLAPSTQRWRTGR